MALPLTERAVCTAAFIRRHRTSDLNHPDHAEQHLRARLRLAALLGLPYQRVNAPYPLVTRGGRHPLILTAADPADPHTRLQFYLHDAAVPDDTFYAMGPCPGCEAQVPLLPVAVLADLAQLLSPGSTPRKVPLAPGDPVYATHPAHPRTCPFRAVTSRTMPPRTR
ncbi:hypothetical protein NGB36_14760 [Streptomyces sp. RB6PN25]|uniref:Uncharacterized protein n=1 Tax=Streptomyces humicola TaxID=2953240 RepID=A0ABT1PW14_9ACTN|nr:hypothetical protein [Streptomyces humicola]MCQ4081834.1 hypothetical protein [Streptomyces humicola]